VSVLRFRTQERGIKECFQVVLLFPMAGMVCHYFTPGLLLSACCFTLPPLPFLSPGLRGETPRGLPKLVLQLAFC